jgi:hypothetical protein
MTKTDVSDSFTTFLETINKEHTTQERLFLTAGLAEILRRTKTRDTVLAMAALLVDVADFPWRSIPFSVTKTLLSEKYRQMVLAAGVPESLVAQVLLFTLQLFLTAVQANEADATEDKLQDVLETVCASAAEPKEPAPKKAPAPVVEIFNAGLLRRCFTPQPLTAAVAEQVGVHLLTYRAPSANGRLLPTLRGLAFLVGTKYATLLETGEYVVLDTDAEHLEILTTNEDLKAVSATMLANVVVAAPALHALGVISDETLERIRAGCFGKITGSHWVGELESVEDLKTIESVFSGTRSSGMLRDAKTPAAVECSPVTGTDMSIVIAANCDDFGPYCVSRLVKDRDGRQPGGVLMRHDTPRQITPEGVYLFPLADKLVSFTAIFNKP